MVRSNNSRRLARTTQNRKTSGAVGEYFEDAWSLAKRTATGLNEIRKLINIEEKNLETLVSATAFDTNGTVYSISTVAQGTDYTQRVGDSIDAAHSGALACVQEHFRDTINVPSHSFPGS